VAKTIGYRTNHQVPLFESPEEAVRALQVSHQQYLYSLWKEEDDLEPKESENIGFASSGA